MEINIGDSVGTTEGIQSATTDHEQGTIFVQQIHFALARRPYTQGTLVKLEQLQLQAAEFACGKLSRACKTLSTSYLGTVRSCRVLLFIIHMQDLCGTPPISSKRLPVHPKSRRGSCFEIKPRDEKEHLKCEAPRVNEDPIHSAALLALASCVMRITRIIVFEGANKKTMTLREHAIHPSCDDLQNSMLMSPRDSGLASPEVYVGFSGFSRLLDCVDP